MAVTYKKLFHILIDRGITNAELMERAGFSANIITRIKHDHYISLDSIRFLYKGIIINHNKKPSQPTLKRRFFQEKGGVFSWPGFGKEWC